MNFLYKTAISVLVFVSVFACKSNTNTSNENNMMKGGLPIIGEVLEEDGKKIYHTVGNWKFYRQDSALVEEKMLKGNPYIVDFFFTSCPTICPRVTSNMLRIYEHFEKQPQLKLVSFTVDPKRDSVVHLRNYSKNIGVKTPNRWWFLTGDKYELFGIADDYFSVVVDDPSAPGGYDHSGRIIFIDEEGHVRAFADGTDEKSVDALMKKIDKYLKETKKL